MRAVADRAAKCACALAGLLLWSCAPSQPPPPAPLPALPVAQVTPPLPSPRLTGHDPLSSYPPGEPVTLSARGADVRSLLAVLAESAGISLVMGPEIQGQVSVNLIDVPALEALKLVLAEADLSVAAGPPEAPWGPVVFYTIPVNIDEASVEVIMARFGVSAEMALWIVESRLPR